MNHIRCISQSPAPAQGQINIFESIVLILLQVFFGDWDNFASVAQNLRKFYSKTP